MEGQVGLGIRNFMIVGLMAVLFIILFKVVFTKFPVKGASEVMAAV